VKTTLILYSPYRKRRSRTSPHSHLIVKTWLLRTVMVERGACGASLVLQAPLRLMTSRRSSPCGMSFKSHATQTSIPTWYRGHYSSAWKLEGAPLADYGEFEAANLTAIGTWRNFYAPDYADVFGGVPRAGTSNDKGKDKKEERQSEEVLQPPPFNPMQ
jgi:hypothetical protein